MNRRIDLIVVLALMVLIAAAMTLSPVTCDCEAKTMYKTETVGAAWKCIGTFRITAYSYEEGSGENYQTAGGYTPTPYYTVATDTSIIPLGTVFKIEGLGTVQAQDTGSAIHGNIIDYHIGYDSCDTFGVKYRKVWIKK